MTKTPLLEIRDLHATIEGREILRGVDLTINAGEVHAIMGPNGSGKSTLAQVLAGNESYEVTRGSVRFKGKELLELAPEERAGEGVFLAFQYPVEIPGVGQASFLRAAVNSVRQYRGQEPLEPTDFLKLVRSKMRELELPEDMLKRSLNQGFSGGEKKRNEILQMSVLEPDLCLLDETDSGLDIDALKVVAHGVNHMRSPKRAMLLITHYERILEHIKPDFVHVFVEGKVVRSGDILLARELEAQGYALDRPVPKGR